jgi:hypothetical protein
MDATSSRYPNFSNTEAAGDEAHRLPHRGVIHRKPVAYKQDYNQGGEFDAPNVSVEESYEEEVLPDDVEMCEDELFQVLYGSKRESRGRKYANATFLSPPQPYLHRRPSAESLTKQLPFVEHASIRRVQSQSFSHDTQGIRQPPNASKPRKGRPTPLALVPPTRPYLAGSHNPPSPYSPYSPSILSLYTSTFPPTPSQRSVSLPLYAFQPSDLPSPRLDASALSASAPSSTSSTPSPRSTGSSPATSIQGDGFWCPMPTPPTPTAVFASRKDRIYKSMAPNEMASIAKRTERKVMEV